MAETKRYKEQELLEIVKKDYDLSKVDHNAKMGKIYRWRREYNGDPYEEIKREDGRKNELEEKRSKLVARDIKKYSSWLESSVIDPFISTHDIVKCFPATPRSTKFAKCAETILNAQFCRQFNRFNFMSTAVSTLLRDGICVVKTGWEFSEDKRKVFYNIDTPLSVVGQPLQPEIPDEQLQQIAQENPEEAQMLKLLSTPMLDELGRQVYHHEEQYKEEVIPVINKPTAILCRNEDIFIDPTCMGDISKAQFIIHQYLTDLSTLKMDGRFKNLDKLTDNDAFAPSKADFDFGYGYDTDFEFEDKTRKKYLVREYWGNLQVDDSGIVSPMVVSWIEDTVIRCEENPYPDKKPPFIIAPFLPIPFDVYGEPNGAILSDNQRVKTAIYRGIIDNMANSNNAQIGIRKGELDDTNRKRMLRGENFEFNQNPQNIFVGNYNQLPQSIFNFLQLVDSESTQLTGVNTYGQQQTTDRIGNDNASKGVLDSGNLRKLQIVKSIAENLVKPLLRKWLEYSAELLEDEQVFRITGGEHFEIIKRDDLYGQIDIDLTISTNEDNAVRVNQLAFLLQTIGPNEDPNIRKMIMAEIMKLHKMPELATRIETYEPEPDPLLVAQQQLMIEKLKAEIAELQANAGKIEQDGILKSAKAQNEGARAEQTRAQTDKINLDFIQQQKGIKEQADMAKLQAQLESQERIAKMTTDSHLANNIYKELLMKSQKEKEEKAKAKEDSEEKVNQNNRINNALKSKYSPKRNEPRNDIKYRE